jgi:hypothetical protein
MVGFQLAVVIVFAVMVEFALVLHVMAGDGMRRFAMSFEFVFLFDLAALGWLSGLGGAFARPAVGAASLATTASATPAARSALFVPFALGPWLARQFQIGAFRFKLTRRFDGEFDVFLERLFGERRSTFSAGAFPFRQFEIGLESLSAGFAGRFSRFAFASRLSATATAASASTTAAAFAFAILARRRFGRFGARTAGNFFIEKFEVLDQLVLGPLDDRLLATFDIRPVGAISFGAVPCGPLSFGAGARRTVAIRSFPPAAPAVSISRRTIFVPAFASRALAFFGGLDFTRRQRLGDRRKRRRYRFRLLGRGRRIQPQRKIQARPVRFRTFDRFGRRRSLFGGRRRSRGALGLRRLRLDLGA